MTRAASVYEFDDLDLDEPEIDNDLESYQVGVLAYFPSRRLDSVTGYPSYVPAGTAGSQL